MTYITPFQGHFEGLCNRNLCKIVLNSVIINTLHVCIYIYMIELFSKAAITSIHVILLQILAVLGWPLGRGRGGGMTARLRLNAPWLRNCVRQDCDISHTE